MIKKPSKLYKDALAFPKTGEDSRFMDKIYQLSVVIGLNSSYISPLLCVFDICAGPKLILSNYLNHTRLEDIHQCDRPMIHDASHTKVKVFGVILFHVRLGETGTRVDFGVLSLLPFSIFLLATYIDRSIRSLHQTERSIVSHYFQWLPLLMMYEYEVEGEINECNFRQETAKGSALSVMPTRCHLKYIKVAGELVITAKSKTPALVYR